MASTTARRLGRILRTGLLGLIILLVLFIAVLAWLTQTRSGSGFLVQRASALLPQTISLGQFDGVLARRFELQNVRVAQEGFDLDIERLHLHWEPVELLWSDLLTVHALQASGVTCLIKPAAEAEAPSSESPPVQIPRNIELPIDIELTELIISRISCRTAPEAEPIAVAQISVREASLLGSDASLRALSIDSDWLRLQLQGQAQLQQDYPINLTGTSYFAPQGFAPLDSTVRIDGDLQRLSADLHINPPYNLQLIAAASRLKDGLQGMSLAADLKLEQTRLDLIQPESDTLSGPVEVNLDAQLSGPVRELQISAGLSGTDEAQRRFDAELISTVTPDQAQLRMLQITQPGRSGTLQGAGVVRYGDGLSGDLKFNWSGMQWPLTGEPQLTSDTGNLAWSGDLSQYTFSTSLALEQQALPPMQIELQGTGSSHNVDAHLRADAQDATLRGEVRADWSNAPQLQAQLNSRQFNPAQFAADWPGRLDIDLELDSRFEQDAITVNVNALNVSGTLREFPVALQGDARYEQRADAHMAQLRDVSLSYGGNRLDVDGMLDTGGQRNNLTWTLSAEHLARLLPQLAGRIEGEGALTGGWPALRSIASLNGRNLGYAGDSLQSLALESDIDLSGQQQSNLDLQLQGGQLSGINLDQLTLTGSGNQQQHSINLMLNSDESSAQLGLDGTLRNAWQDDLTWSFSLNEGLIHYAPLAPWRLGDPASGTLTGPGPEHGPDMGLQLNRHCWGAQSAQLCIAAEQAGDQMQADVQLQALPFAYFAALLPDQYNTQGTLNGHVSMIDQGDGLQAGLDLTSSPGRLTVELAASDPADTEPAQNLELRLEPMTLTARLDEAGVSSQFDLATDKGSLTAEFSTAPIPRSASGAMQMTDLPIHLRTAVDIPSLAFTADLIPAVREAAGRIAGSLQVSGTTSDPLVSGSMALADGRLHIPDQGLRYTDLGVSLRGEGAEGVALNASAASNGDGALQISGTLGMQNGLPAADLNLSGERFQLLNTHEARIRVSPDMRVEAADNRINVTGQVEIPFAQITPDPQPPSAIQASPDQVLLSPEQSQGAADRVEQQLHADLRIILSDEVSFEGFGLKARLEGNVLAQQRPDTPVTASGELRLLDGEYRAYGQGLVIESGGIYFAGGPITRPALDVRAVRRPVEGILVGAHVQGTLEQPEFELFSEPGMTQQEQLSYLVLGRSLNETSGGESSALSQAALALGVKGGDALAKKIGSSLGVDEIGVRAGSGEAGAASDPNDAALVVGKYLSPKLYISYGIGIFEPSSILRLQYEISRHWKLITESGDAGTAADVIYTIEVGDR